MNGLRDRLFPSLLSLVCGLLLGWCGLAGAAQPVQGSGCGLSVRGINLVQLPTGWRDGHVELQFPGEEHVKYYKSVGFNVIRLPVSWEELQPELMGPLSERYVADLMQFLDIARTYQQPVLVEIHNYARYRNQLIGSPAVPVAAFTDVWKRLAGALKSHSAVYAYGLMNEPHDTNRTWQSVAQYGVDGIRSADMERVIYVSGDNWSNSQLWPQVHPAPFVRDPQGRIVYEAHLYLDDDFSGRYQIPLGNVDLQERVKTRLTPFIDWLKKNKQRGAITETGVPSDAVWRPGMEAIWDTTDANCVEWFLWAGGRWSAGYLLSLEPQNGVDRPQVQWLRERITSSMPSGPSRIPRH